MRVTPLLLAFCCHAAAQPIEPAAAEKEAIVARMRSAALSYADQLQDFICTQTQIRSVDSSGKGRYRPLETQEAEVAYVAHKESTRLLKVNGKTTNLDRRVKKGYFTPGGEFGSDLLSIFVPKAQAKFEWDHGETIEGRRVCVFRYDVPLETTTRTMRTDFDVHKLGHHGTVYADCDTGAVLRFHMISDVPTITFKGHRIQIGTDTEVRYGMVALGEKEFLLPLEVEEVARFHTSLTRAQIHFRDYRKYDSTSRIAFDDR